MMSFVHVEKDSDFSYHNLPYGIFSTGDNPNPRVGVAIGDYVLDLGKVNNLFDGPCLSGRPEIFHQPTLNAFISLGRPAWTEARETLKKILSKDEPVLRDNERLRARALIPRDTVTMHLPVDIGDYTDFFGNKKHAHNTGSMFMEPNNPIRENWFSMPQAYHGRASSVLVSGTPVRRPYGQSRMDPTQPATFGPSKLLDFELEMAFLVGPGNEVGRPIKIEEAENHIFGMVLMNDWSARDVQFWEMIPLGPFLGKNFGTSISPWVVTMDALRPFTVANVEQVPAPMSYLQHNDDYNFDIKLTASIKADGLTEPAVVCKSNYKCQYWTMKQQLVHHTVTGCNVRPGDLMGSGTISGETPDSFGCLLELCWKGTKPLDLGKGISRTGLLDGDEVIFHGYCEGKDHRVGFGTCTGKILPALPLE